jgi:hypothetical protein
MKKLQSVLILLILILTVFSSFNFTAQSASAASANLSYPDTSYENTTVTYYNQSTAISNPSANNVTISSSGSVSATTFSLDNPNPSSVYAPSGYDWEEWNVTLSGTVYVGDPLTVALAGGMGIGDGNYNLGAIYVTIYISGNTQTMSAGYGYDTSVDWGDPYYTFYGSINSSYSGSLTEVSIKMTGDPAWSAYDLPSIYSDPSVASSSITTSGPSYGTDTIAPTYYTYSGSTSSSFSSQIPSNLISFKIFWSAQKSSYATYDGTQYTSSPISGVVGEYSISFSSQTTDLLVSSYGATYNVSATYYVYTQETQTKSATTSYTVSEAVDGTYFNASFSFSFSFSSSSLYANSSYPIFWGVNVSHLLNEYTSAPVNLFSYLASPDTYTHTTLGSGTLEYWDFVLYYNSTSSSATSVTFSISTTETVNFYPTIDYANIKWAGTASESQLIVNASNHFANETIQILNINWGDGSALQSSSEQTGSYNWTLYHYYQAAGSYSASFQVENWIGNSNALSTTKTLTYTISITISNSPANNAIIQSGQKIWFNWTNQNAGMTSVSLKIDSILQESNTYPSQLSGSISFSPTYLGTLSISWYWTAGNISGYDNLTYSTSTHVGKTGLYVLVNYTVSPTSYSSYYYYSQVSPSGTNFTWAYFTWNIQLPPGATLQSIKGNTTWIFQSGYPGLYVYYKGNASIHFYLNSSSYQVVWLAPLPPSFGYFTIEYAPTSPVMQMLGIGISSNAFKTYVNGIQVPSLQVPSQMGQTYNIKAYDSFGNLVVNTTYTPQYQFSTDEIPVSYFPVTWTNLNSSWKIQLTIASNGVTIYGLPHVMPEGGELTLYMPPGTYWFNATYLGYLNNTPGPSVDKLYSVSNVTDEIFSGITLAMVETTAVKNAQNLTQLVDSVNITLINSNSKVYNETLKINASIVNTNSSIIKQVLDENTTINNIYSKVSTINSDIQVIQNNILSDVNSTRINITTRETTIKDLVSLSLQEENSTFSYQLKFGTPSVQGETYEFPVFVTLFNGQMANLSVTQQAWQNLKLYYVTGNQTHPLNFSVSNEQAGSFVINIYNVTPAMATGISSGQGLITAQGEVKEGLLTNLAAGIIGSQQVQYSSSSLWTDIFGIQPPNANDSVSGMFQYLSWLDESYAGRAIYMIVVLSALTYYLVMINMKLEERRKK